MASLTDAQKVETLKNGVEQVYQIYHNALTNFNNSFSVDNIVNNEAVFNKFKTIKDVETYIGNLHHDHIKNNSESIFNERMKPLMDLYSSIESPNVKNEVDLYFKQKYPKPDDEYNDQKRVDHIKTKASLKLYAKNINSKESKDAPQPKRKYDQIVKGDVKIVKTTKYNSEYKIVFKKAGKFLVYQVWDNRDSIETFYAPNHKGVNSKELKQYIENNPEEVIKVKKLVTLNDDRNVRLLTAKKWVMNFEKLNDTFKPTTVMSIGNKKYVFVINNAIINSNDEPVFYISTKEIKVKNNKMKSMTKIPCGKLYKDVRFDIDSYSVLQGLYDSTTLLTFYCPPGSFATSFSATISSQVSNLVCMSICSSDYNMNAGLCYPDCSLWSTSHVCYSAGCCWSWYWSTSFWGVSLKIYFICSCDNALSKTAKLWGGEEYGFACLPLQYGSTSGECQDSSSLTVEYDFGPNTGNNTCNYDSDDSGGYCIPSDIEYVGGKYSD